MIFFRIACIRSDLQREFAAGYGIIRLTARIGFHNDSCFYEADRYIHIRSRHYKLVGTPFHFLCKRNLSPASRYMYGRLTTAVRLHINDYNIVRMSTDCTFRISVFQNCNRILRTIQGIRSVDQFSELMVRTDFPVVQRSHVMRNIACIRFVIRIRYFLRRSV